MDTEQVKDLPKLKGRVLTERITIPLDKKTKSELTRMKLESKVDVSEWIRQLIRDGLKAAHKVQNVT